MSFRTFEARDLLPIECSQPATILRRVSTNAYQIWVGQVSLGVICYDRVLGKSGWLRSDVDGAPLYSSLEAAVNSMLADSQLQPTYQTPKFQYILVQSRASDNYLGFGSEVEAEVGKCKVIRCLKEHVRWQLDRYASGMRNSGYEIFMNRDEALEMAQKMSALVSGK